MIDDLIKVDLKSSKMLGKEDLLLLLDWFFEKFTTLQYCKEVSDIKCFRCNFFEILPLFRLLLFW
jgi:hypothetical protein